MIIISSLYIVTYKCIPLTLLSVWLCFLKQIFISYVKIKKLLQKTHLSRKELDLKIPKSVDLLLDWYDWHIFPRIATGSFFI